MQPWRSDVKGEQGRHGWCERVTERNGELAQHRRAAPADGQQQLVAGGLSSCSCEFKSAGWILGNRIHATVGDKVDTRGTRRVEQAIDDRLRAVGDRKHAAIFLSLELHAARREPLDRVARLELLEGAE